MIYFRFLTDSYAVYAKKHNPIHVAKHITSGFVSLACGRHEPLYLLVNAPAPESDKEVCRGCKKRYNKNIDELRKPPNKS